MSQELTKVFDGWRTEFIKGDLPGALAFRSAETRKYFGDELASGNTDKDAMKAFLRLQAPDSYVVGKVRQAGDRAQLRAVFTLNKLNLPDHPNHGKAYSYPQKLEFVREGGAWKLDTVGDDPGAIPLQKKAPEKAFEPEEKYDQGRRTSVSGRILGVAFNDAYVLVSIQIVDEEQLVYLPPKKFLEEHGFDTGKLVEGALLEAKGHPHPSKGYKTFATSASVSDAE